MADQQNTNPFSDPEYGKDKSASNKTSNPFSDPNYGKEQNKGLKGHLQDTGASLMSGLAAVPDTLVGIADMYTEGRAGKAIDDNLGDYYKLGNAQNYWQDQKTDIAKQQQKQFHEADGIVDKTKVSLQNPSMIANAAVESLPSMFLGGALGKVSKIANPVVAASVGEGAVMAGAQAEQIRQNSDDQMLNNGQEAAAALTGGLGALFGFAGGRLAQKMGLSDVDTAMQTGRLTTQQVGEEIAKTPMSAIPTAMIKGAISEGFLEELPQSVAEQVIQNLALNKPWHDGIEDASVMGTLAGMAMGGTVSGLGKAGDWLESSAQQRAIEKNWTQSEAEYQKNLLDEYRLRSHQEQEKVWNAQDDEKFLADLSHHINNKNGRFLNQPTEEMGNLGNQIGTGVNPNLLGFNPNNDPDAPVNPNGPDTPPAPNDNSPNGNYFDNDYGSDAAFDDLLAAVPPVGQTPSQQMGINPNDGPMSSAAALAVDSGASPVAQLGYTPTQQTQEQSNTPISDALPSDYRQLLESQNGKQPFSTGLENAGESTSQQYDANAIARQTETNDAAIDQTETIQPILGADGKNKWFGNQEKAQAFIDKKDLGNDYQVVQDGKRFEIQPKPKSQDDAYFQSKLDDLDKQRAAFEAVGDDVNATNIYGEMQKVSREWQIASAKNQPGTSQTPKKEYQETESDKAWAEHYSTNRNMIGDDLFEGGHNDKNELKNAPKDVQSRSAHGMAKSTPASAVADLKKLLNDGIDPNRGGGRLFTAPLNNVVANEEERRAASMSGTSSGSSYGDGAFTLVAKQGIGDISNISEVEAVMVNSAVPVAVVEGLRQDFPNMKFGYAKELPSLLSGGKQSNNAQAQVAELEQQLKNEKSVPKKAQLRNQITELQNGLADQSQVDVPNPYNENQLRANVRHLSLQASKEAQAQNAEDSNYIADLGSTASARSNEKVKQQFPELYKRAEELAKTAEIRSAGRRGNTRFSSLSFKSDPSFVSGDSWTKRPTSDEILQQAIWHLSQDDKNGTSSTDQSQGDVPPNNELQNNSDATQKNKAKNPVKDTALKGMATSILSGNRAEVQDMIEALGITEEEIASIQPDSKDNYLDRDFKYLPTADRVGVGSNQERAIYLPKTKGKKAQWQRIEDDYVLAMDGGRFVDLPKMTREQAIELSNRDGENKYYDVVPRAYANHLGYKPVADIKNLADSTQETAPPNAAPNTEDLVSVTTTDGKTHVVLASELNDSNVKNLTKFSAQGKRVAVKLPRSRIASTSEQNKQPKQGEQQKVEANEQRESKIQSFINKWNQLKENGTASELDNFHKKVKIALNGYAQGKGVVAEFEQLKADIENFAKDYNKLPKTEQSTNTGTSAAETSTEQITTEIDSEATKTEATQKPKVEVSENTVSEDTFESVRAELKEIESSGYPKDKAQRQARLEKRIELNNKLLSLTSDPSIKREYRKQISKLQESIKTLNGERTVRDIANDIEKVRTKRRSVENYEDWINDDLEHARLLRELADTVDDKSSSEHYRKEAEKVEKDTLELRKHAESLSSNTANSGNTTTQAEPEQHAWDQLSVDEKTAVLQKAGWRTNAGGLNIIGKKLAGQTSKQITPETLKTIERFMGSESPQQAEAPKTEQPKVEATKTEATKTEAAPKPKVEASENRLVSDDRAAELRARLKAKLSQLNSGIDPEIMAIGAELAVYHIERGARKFAAFAKNIAADLDVSVDKIRPYLRSWYNGARDMMEDMGSDIQGMDNAETVRAELAKLDNPQQQSNVVQGKTETVVTPSGREFEVQHKVVEVDELITSNLDSGAVNTEYPQALQPRDRTTLKSVTQINDIANKLNPKLLGDSASSTNGAPIVSSDNEVESGNGRTLAIRKAYQLGKADAYKSWLANQGYDVANMQQPILVRERITPMNMAERVAYTTESNERDTLDMSPSEQAMSDAPKVMDILHLVQGGSFNNTANREFVNAFLTGVASKNERGTMLDKDGVSLTQDGYRRIESALLAAAFNDAQIISQVIESKDSDIKAIGNALIEAAPQWAQVRKGVQEGILVEGVNIEANLVEAVHLIRKARQQNLSLSEMLNQDDMFDGSIDQVTKDLVSIFYRGDKLDKARSSQKVAEALKSYAQLAMTAKASPNLFGDAPLSTEQILGQVHDRLKQSEAEKQQDFFSSQGNDDTGNGKPSETGQGPASSQSNAATSKSNTAVTRPTVERPKNDTTLVQDWGVQYVDGYAKNDQYPGKVETDYGFKDGVKAAFLKDSKKYLEDVQKNLESIGYELHLDKKGKPQKVSVNESGVAGSGEVSLYIREPVTGTNVYVSIGDGRPGSHPQRIGIMYRATMKESDKQASGFGIENSGNQYAGANTSAFELAQMIDDMVTALVKRNQNKENSNEQPASNASNPQGASAVRGGRGRTSQSDVASGNNRNVDEGVSTGSGASNQNQSTGRSRIRDTGTDVANDAGVSGRGMESSRRKDASRTGQLPVDQPTRLESPAAVANTATDFYMADPELIIGGTQVKRFDKNKAALELLEELTNEGRQATTEEQAILAGYTGWGSFGQDLFQGTWDKPVFKDESVWKERNLWLREKLGKEAWESAKDSTINAHFTDPYTVAAMWAMAEKMGFTGGRVLEPAIGTGNFISLMPMHIKQRSQVTGIDLDITTAAIAKQLFPESNVQNMPYQKSKTPDNFYDLVISNVPFADIKIADRRYNQFNPNLHDYYFLKMLDQVRPGGIVMAITSSGTMDKQSEVIRRELAKKAELITSVRLPSGAFQEYAGTAVVTDIIVLRKRAEPLTMTPEVNWIGLSEVKTSSKPVKVNSFYAENLRNVLGDIDYGSGTTRFGAGMIVHRPHDLKQRLEKAADFVPENALMPRHSEDHFTYYANKAGERTNTLTISNGELMFVYGDQMVKATDLSEYKLKDAKKTAQRQKSIEDLIAIRKAYTDLTDAERIEQDNVEQLRKTLNKLYQAYTKEHGPLADSFGLQYFHKLGDAYYYSLAALEVNGKPAEILKRSVVRGADTLKNPTVSDAFVVERNKTAIPSLTNIAKLANVSEDQARAELIAKGAIYVLPNGDIMPSDMYLSGNVRLKLEEAQNAVAEGNTDLQRNVDALKEIIPEDIPYFNIEAKMGATWVPLSDYENYIAHMLGMTDSTGIKVTFPNGKWKVKLENNASRRTEASTNYGTKYKSFQTVVSAALSNQTITVKYKNADGSESVDVQATEEVNEKISKIKEDFATWLWSDPERRVQLEKEYNHTFNAWATPKYDGSFMSMQGMALSLGNGPFNLRQHQQNAIWRAIVNRRSINAHEVGTGKTFTMGGIAIESRRYGIAKKPLILAHNANSAAVAKEIQMMYPSARVLFISELGKAVRQIRMRQIANDDWDVVVMPHSMIDKLTLSEETLMAMAADDIAALESELEEALAEEGGATLDEVLAMNSDDVNKKMGFKNPTAKQLAKQRLKLLEDIQKQAMDSSKADAVNFEELGVDMIMVDEVHEFKKPSIATRMNMKGLNTSSNKRSVNLQLLTRYVRRMNNGGNVHTFTGTPITNTLTEIYHQMRYVMEEEMQKLNVAAWDGWFGSFATDITDIELSATGEYQLVTRLAGFVNVPELRKMIGQFMDIVFANDMPEMQPRKTKSGKILSDESLTEAEKAELLNGRTEDAKDRPYKKVINVTTEMSPKQEQALAEIQSLAKEWERASGKQKRKWMRDGDPRAPLSISTAAKKASYDARIGDPEYIGQEGKTEDFEMSKASQVVKNVMEVYQSHPLASQVIFADTGYNTTTERSTGQKDGNGKTIRERVKVFSPIKDIVERLVQSGIPREQIAIVDGSVKAEARKAIADKMNTGEIRVVIGLTQTLGVGVNMQRNLRAMHHLDAPWMPGELEQRNGRGLRQGNQWNTVLEYRYITDKLDGKSWQVLAIKDRFINSFMKADGNVRSIEGDAAADNGEDNAGDIMSSFSEASGDPRVLQRIKMKEKLEKLQRKERLHTQGIADMKRTIGNTQRRIARIDEQIAEYENNAVLDRIQTLMQSQSENFSVEVDGKKYDKHKEASDAIQQFIVDRVRTGSSRITLGKYGNVTMSVEWDSLQPQATLSMKIGPIEFKGNTLRGIEGKLRGAAQDVKALQDAKVSAQDTINSLSKAVEQPFGQTDQLARTQKQLENIEQDLEINPVAPPIWLRRGAPIDSEVYYKGKLFIVSGHRYTNDGWFVSAEDAKGTIEVPYLEATDSVGMPIYEEREFEAPNIEDKTQNEEVKQPKETGSQQDPLYSRKSGNQKTGKTIAQVREALIKRFGKATIETLEKQGKLEIIQDYQVEGVEGYYRNGKAVLVESNLNDDTIIPTFLHELGGHAGFQNMMTNAQYSELMKQFDKLVEQGNPVAIAAKELAEREQGLERQQLEYLPYLLTLASTMQQKNVLQRNALQRLIRNLISHVKAWLFDKFSINLNLNPDDMVALAERMIDQAASNAIGNNDGTENNQPLYSRVDLSGSINRLSESFKQASVQSANQWLKNKAKDTLGIALQALTRRQIMEVYGKLLPQLSRYNHIVELMDADATETSVNADNIVNEWADLKDEQQLAELMHEATLAKIDPAKPFVSGSGASISKYAQLRKVYDALTPEAQAMYVKARDAYSKHYADVHQAIKERILRSELSNQKKADLLKQMDDNFFGQVKGVYFPLARFGKYVVVVRDANGVVESVNRAETLNEAEAVRIELQKQFPNSKVSPVTKDKEFNASRDGVGRGFMSELFKEAGNLGLSAKDQADFEDTLSQLYLASMPDLSWAKHGIHRKGMAGFSQNARRAFAQNMLHGGSYLAKLRYGDQLAEQLDSMKKTVEKEIDANPDYDQVTARNVYEEMEKRHESYMNPKPHPVSTALTSLGFVYYLGLSPAAAMVNLSQTALVAYPMMGAKFGFRKSAAALKAAMADFAKGVDVKNRNLDITKSLNTDEKKAYEEALRRGVIDKTQVHSLAGVAQGEDSGLSEKLKPIMKWSSFMFHHAERFNREVTFVAAYRLAKEHSIVENGKPRKLTNDEALEMAIDMTYKGHFDYSAGNRARFMQGNVAKVVLLFKQFAQNMIFTLMRQAYLSMYGMDVNERNEARKALAAILAFHGMAAGLLGLPIATSLVAASFLIAKKNPMLGMLFGAGAAAVFFGAGGDDDDPWDLEVEIRNYAAEILGADLANYLMKGAPRALGTDISGRVGLDNLVIPKYQEGLEGQNLSNSIMAGALGPVAGIGANLFKGGQELGDGNLGRAMEAMLPVFMKNPIKAMRYADEGVQDKTGISIQDEVGAWGVFNQSIGFSPADVRLAYEGRAAIYQKQGRLKERRGELMSMWSRARKQDDQEEMDAIWEEIQAFNEINPKIRINRMQLMQSYRQSLNRVNKSEDGIYVTRKYEDSREAGAFAFGE